MSDSLVDLLLKYDVALPRYTSYPTAPEWGDMFPTGYAEALNRLGSSNNEVSLYVHIPFCKTMCLFCACSVVLNRRYENEERYVEYLCKEIDLVAKQLGKKKTVRQLHFGGGTPTKLTIGLLEKLYKKLRDSFVFADDAEIAIEIDPRTVYADDGEKLIQLKEMGFNRVSFGVQDTDPRVQEAIRRRQSYEVTKYTFDLARKLNFSGINIDLIYGLPLQTQESFCDTVEKIIEMGPDRIALFSYAKVPWLKEHQKAINDADLPQTTEKFAIYVEARDRFVQSGYKAIGMDHFAKAGDPLASAYMTKTLQRNFQGYSVLDVGDLIGFGVTSIGFLQNTYSQNVKELKSYYALLDENTLCACKGTVLSSDDVIRRWTIQKLMCNFRIDKKEFTHAFGIDFDEYFERERGLLDPFKDEGFVSEDEAMLSILPEGELFVRNITATFDWYLAQKKAHRSFSKAI